MSTNSQPLTRMRSSLANAAWAVEDRVVLGGMDLARGTFDVAKWPFERVAWAAEERVVWPLRERSAEWGRGAQAAGLAAIVAVAIGAGAFGVSFGKSGKAESSTVTAPASAAAALPLADAAERATARPLLDGGAPVFVPEAGVDTGRATAAGVTSDTVDVAGGASGATATSGAAERAVPAGPAAMRVARSFAEAFVLYEIGEQRSRAKRVFGETATPQLAKDLAARPPQLPANVRVPQAKVLNIVPGPRRGRTYTVSVSLLRVGVTSELRLDLAKAKDGWSVVNVRA